MNNKNLFIISSNIKENIHQFLKKYKIDYFDYVLSGSSLFGKDKLINKLIKSKNISKEATIYVGDEVRDIDASHNSGIKIAAVTWGYNSKEILEFNNPDMIVKDPKELLNYLL
jgi:phosphoglycolate phosphatase